jgi:FkbM family methyltransferase
MDRDDPVERRRSGPRISYAQNQEDILLDRLFRDRPGTFMDVGGNHPFIDNNTYFFYVRGWRGVNIEPTRSGIELFRDHRPEDLNLEVAASDSVGELPFFEVEGPEGMTGLSTLSAEVAEAHRAEGFTVIERAVPVKTVGAIAAEHGIDPPDILSIDVECHEDAVLRGVPLDSWRPKVLVIESTVPLSEASTHHQWEPGLLEKGYIFAAFNGVNRFYLRDDLRDSLGLFDTPVNALDRFLRREVVALSNEADAYRDRLRREEEARAFDRAQFDQIRAGWEWGTVQAQHAQAVWQKECESFATERVSWASALEHFERTQAHFEAERAAWERQHHQFEADRATWEIERAHYQRTLAETQTELRPYRLIDRLGFVTRGYGLARRVRNRAAS